MSRYFDIHDILADETLLPVTFRYGSTGIARLIGGVSNTASGSSDVEPGSSAELPLWLCKVLSSKDLVQVKRPTFLGERALRRIQRRLTAGAACENLKARCPYYFSASKDFCSLDPERDVDLTTVIFNAFRERYHKIAGSVLGNDRSEDAGDFRQKLTQEEAHLYEGALTAAHNVQAWKFDHAVSSATFQEKGW